MLILKIIIFYKVLIANKIFTINKINTIKSDNKLIEKFIKSKIKKLSKF